MTQTMNLVNKLNQQFVLDKIKETNWHEGNTGPLVVELDPTAVCDLACPGCISADVVAVGNSFTNERLMAMGAEMIEIGVKAVILIGGGELVILSLAHPKTGDFITYMGKNNVHIGITTNGTLIHRFINEIAEYSKWTRVSVDASSDKMFQNVRPNKGGRSKFERVIKNMYELAKIKKGKLGFSFLIQTEADCPGLESNIHEIYSAGELAKDIGCDYFEVKPSYVFRDDKDHTLMIHKKELMQMAKIEIDKLEKLEDDNFKIMKAINLDYSLNRVQTSQNKTYSKCPSTHLRTTITPSGVYICPYWRGKSNFRIGDASNTNLKELWNGEKRSDIMKNTDISDVCKNIHCLRHNTNNQCLTIKNDIDNNIEIDVVDEFDRFI